MFALLKDERQSYVIDCMMGKRTHVQKAATTVVLLEIPITQ